jgi:release factor glutamine methyltransferase
VAAGDATIGSLLAASGIARNEAALLLAHVLGTTRVVVATYPEREVAADRAERYRALAARRLAGEPIAYLVGQREFYGRAFAVGPAVLVPRPETELLVDLALGWIDAGAVRVLDLGTGSGAIAVSIAAERPGAAVTAVDVSPEALSVAAANVARHGVAVRLVRGDWYGALPPDARFDAIVANPPYVDEGDEHLARGDLRFEPRLALTPGPDGLSAVRAIASGAVERLAPGGRIALEHGWDQAARVQTLLRERALLEVCTHKDLAGHDRVTTARRRP